jgi:GAF domain-containing protein
VEGTVNKDLKESQYQDVLAQLQGVLAVEKNLVARMATAASVLKSSFSYYYWCGFYVVDALHDRELVVGPYQGPMGCLRIPFGKGVCGTVALSKESMIVPDVHKIANHIACDAKSRSEIVVPVITRNGDLFGVIDVDSDQYDSFDRIDQKYLEMIAQMVL